MDGWTDGQVMRSLLWAAEYDVLEARSGQDALDIIRTCELLPDLVLLDVTLGGSVSGFEVGESCLFPMEGG